MKIKKQFKSMKKRIATFVCVLVSLATLLSACAIFAVSCGNKNAQKDSSFVRIKDGGKTLSAAIPVDEGIDGKDIYLFAIDLWRDGIGASDKPVAEAKISGGEARAEVKIDSNLSEMLCKGYLFARKIAEDAYSPITGIYYATNPREAYKNAKDNEDEAVAPMKGAIGNVSQLLDLGARSTVVTVELGDFMLGGFEEDSVPYVWNGLTYYASSEALDELDKTLRLYSDAGVYVYLELVQTKSKSELPRGVSGIAFDAPKGRKGYALNMTDPEGTARICGLFDLLSERYGNGGENGRASAFIIGRNVNDMTNWYAGGPSGERGVHNYIKAVRAAYNILLSHTPEGRVYISVNNGWNVADNGGFTTRDMLSSFNNLVGAEGDFYWCAAVESNASDLSDSSIWDDPMASGKSNFISPANIEVLTNQLAADIYRCDGMERRILLNRFVVGGFDEEARAASYAYAYYKCLSVGAVDSVIYGAVTDGDIAGGGLLNADSSRKKIADIVCNIDDENGIDLSFASALIGSKWDYLYNKFNKDAITRHAVFTEGGSEHSNDETRIIADFSDGDSFGFVSSEGTRFTELRYSPELERPVLYAQRDPSAASGKVGVISSAISADLFEKTGYLGISAFIGSVTNEAVITVRLSGLDNEGIEHVFTAYTDIRTNEWVEFYCDVEMFTDDIEEETVQLAIFVEDAEELYISELVGEAPEKTGLPGWIIALIIVLAVGGALTVFIIWFRKNYTFVRS